MNKIVARTNHMASRCNRSIAMRLKQGIWVAALLMIQGLFLPVSAFSFSVGLVTDVGVIDDKSFNESAWEGVKRAALTLGAGTKYIETRDAKDYMANISLFAKNKYDVIVTVGFGLTEATRNAATVYPDIQFIGVDQFQREPLKNVSGLVFREDQAGFEAGLLAGLLTRSNIIAAIFATDMIPPIVAFKTGFEKGARHVNPSVRIISSYHPGGFDVAFTDPGWGAETAKQAILQGADVVFGAGGLTGNGALLETASHKGCYCIGVDTDQWLTLQGARPCLVSCALKKIPEAVEALVRLASEKRLPPGNFYGEVGLSSFHGFENAIPQEDRNRLDLILKEMKEGKISLK
jgi:basic membrane protein A